MTKTESGGISSHHIFQVIVGLLLTIGIGISSWTVSQVVDLKERLAREEAAMDGTKTFLIGIKNDFNSSASDVSSELRELRKLLNEMLLRDAKKAK